MASIIREQRQTYGEYHPRTSANVWRVSSENNGKRIASIIQEQRHTYGEYHPRTTANVWRVSSENNGQRMASIIRKQRQTYGKYHPRDLKAPHRLVRVLCIRTTGHQPNTCDLCLKTYSDKVYHVLFQCECNNRVNIIKVFFMI